MATKVAPLIEDFSLPCTLDVLAERLPPRLQTVLLHSATADPIQARYSFLAARPFLTFRSWGSRCEIEYPGGCVTQFGDPWRVLDELLSRYEILDEVDLPFPLGGCFGIWGYGLKHFVEPRLARRAVDDLALPDCVVGFYGSLLVSDQMLGKTWLVATGLQPDGSRSPLRAEEERAFWRRCAGHEPIGNLGVTAAAVGVAGELLDGERVRSNLSRTEFVSKVKRAQHYIRTGEIYQVNVSHRLTASWFDGGWSLFQRLVAVSPAPFSAYVDAGDFQVASSSPELFLRLSGRQIRTRPIKGTRPRSADPTRDAQLSYELQTSTKEMAELIMITDLLRNDLGRVCEYGSVQVPELVRLERYPQVQHLVSTIEGRLGPSVTHLQALAACFPGGSITGAPKVRAMEIIEELEPVTRGPYTGCVGYLGFNRESQLSILIRAGVCCPGSCHFHVGAGIVADSEAEAEYEETMAKAGGFLAALRRSA